MKKIEKFLHCKKCWENKPPHLSMRDYARLSVGMTQEGTLQVWCERHDMEVGNIAVVPDPRLSCDCHECGA